MEAVVPLEPSSSTVPGTRKRASLERNREEVAKKMFNTQDEIREHVSGIHECLREILRLKTIKYEAKGYI